MASDFSAIAPPRRHDARRGCLNHLHNFHRIPSLKPTWHLKTEGWNTRFLLGWPIFRGYLSFWEGTPWQINGWGSPKSIFGRWLSFSIGWFSRFQSLIFRGVELTGGCQMFGTTKPKKWRCLEICSVSGIWWVFGCWEHGCCVARTPPKGFWWMWMSTLKCSLFWRRFQTSVVVPFCLLNWTG